MGTLAAREHKDARQIAKNVHDHHGETAPQQHGVGQASRVREIRSDYGKTLGIFVSFPALTRGTIDGFAGRIADTSTRCHRTVTESVRDGNIASIIWAACCGERQMTQRYRTVHIRSKRIREPGRRQSEGTGPTKHVISVHPRGEAALLFLMLAGGQRYAWTDAATR